MERDILRNLGMKSLSHVLDFPGLVKISQEKYQLMGRRKRNTSHTQAAKPQGP